MVWEVMIEDEKMSLLSRLHSTTEMFRIERNLLFGDDAAQPKAACVRPT
jgi:hypothetical protein